MPSSFDKTPGAVLDYAVDWAAWLGTDTIATSTWDVPNGITKDSDSHTTTKATIWLSGGTVGQTYNLKNHIVTVNGRTDDRTLHVTVKNK